MIRNTASVPGYWFGNRVLFLTQILTQNRKFRYGRGSTKGKTHPEYPCWKAPNGRFSAEKTPRPILLSSRSGVRVPSGVPFLLPEWAVSQQLQVRKSPIGLEPLNATVRWTVARDGSTERLLPVTSPFWRAIFTT